MIAQSQVLDEVLWTEKYRPRELADVALDDANRALIQSYLTAGEIPHLLLLGPAGSGKTTVARILIRALDCAHIALNASSERGIDTVRQKIGSFATAVTGARWNIVFLDEGDELTSDAQTALRNTMEAYAERTRFIITGNRGHRIIGPIQSRCQQLTFGRPPLKERCRVLLRVLHAEGVEVADPRAALSYAEAYPDMRQMLLQAERAVLAGGRKALPMLSKSAGSTGDDLVAALLAKQWNKFTQLTTSGDFDPLQSLRDMFWAVPAEHPRAFFLRKTLGRGCHESGFTPDPIVLFLGVVSEVMDAL